MSVQSRPRVYARIRPQNENEIRNGGGKCFYSEKGHADVLVCADRNGESLKTRFDRVFDDSTQPEVFSHVGTEVLNTLFSGYNASVFAYGQTGSGKTFTMEGGHDTAEQRGIIPRTLEGIFDRFKSNPDITEPQVELSFVQIYQEKIQDLFNSRKQLEIRMDKTSEYVAQGAVWVNIRSSTEALRLYDDGVKIRATSATDMNLVSSRSHTILMVKLQWDEPEMPGCRAQVNLIDLAGSEKLYQSHATGEVMKEAIAINKSLSALGNVVSKLVDAVKHKNQRIHIPYKDSKLTYLLQSSLGGNNLVHFVLALSASSLWKPESNATVDFGKRALQLVLKPMRNPIDYKRLEEMENMIEKMRDRIQHLEKELESNKTNPAFLQLKQLHQHGEEDAEKKRRSKNKKSNRRALKTKTELTRIVNNLPETLEDLTSHCVLHPSSKAEFRAMSGLEKLVFFIDKSPSTFYRAHAAHTVAHVIDDDGRDVFGDVGGIDALGRLLMVREERCKEAACVALEAVVRNCVPNKEKLRVTEYENLCDLVNGYANQQVQEAACTALASIVDTYEEGKRQVAPLGLVEKLVQTIDGAPEEIVHVTKAAATCLGRLAHGDVQMQSEIQRLGGVELLIDQVLFSSVGERDHQVPILASYALVNLCCSNEKNMAVVRRHPRWEEVQFRLVEGLARAFGNNCVRENVSTATARDTASPFPYYGVTVMDEWTPLTCGGRPIFSTFMENPQFRLTVKEDTKLTLMIQDILYEQRMMQKQRNNTVYMGLAIFQGDADLIHDGLKQLDFHGKMVEIAKFTSNCENVLNCTLRKSDTPYIVVPFTSQRGRSTSFALSAFGDQEVELTKIPENSGWIRELVHGGWNNFTSRNGDSLEWRNNSQVSVTPSKDSRVVFVLSYKTLDDSRSSRREEGVEDEKANTRPRLHGRVFSHQFAPEKRYLKSLVPLPQHSTFVGTNSFSSNSYITTTVDLKADMPYVFIPFTETEHHDTWKLCVYSDCSHDEISVKPIVGPDAEWSTTPLRGVWKSEPVRMTVTGTGNLCIIASCKDTFLRLSLYSPTHERIGGVDAFWNGECNAEFSFQDQPEPVTVVLEGMVKNQGVQKTASGSVFDMLVFTSDTTANVQPHFASGATDLKLLSTQTAKDYNSMVDTNGVGIYAANARDDIETFDDPFSLDDDDDDSDYTDGGGSDAETKMSEMETKHKSQMEQYENENGRLRRENEILMSELKEKEQLITLLKRKVEDSSAASSPASATSGGSSAAFAFRPGLGTGAMNAVRQTSSRSGPRGRQLISQGGARSRSGSSTPGATPPTTQRHGVGGPSADVPMGDIGTKLGHLATSDKPPSAAEWSKMRKELRDTQLLLMLSAAGGKK